LPYESRLFHNSGNYSVLQRPCKGFRVLGISNIAKGGIDGAFVDIRIILQTALKASASAIMFSHNHPSGSIIPSAQDKAITKKIQDGCKAVDIILLDHIIVTGDAYMSFADEGLL
jgi:DNA repair protein RadC